jgi:hypothetical protein
VEIKLSVKKTENASIESYRTKVDKRVKKHHFFAPVGAAAAGAPPSGALASTGSNSSMMAVGTLSSMSLALIC